jgi:RPA family protein
MYAGNYQPEAMAALKIVKPPMYIAIVRKLRMYERGDRINVSIEPESITVIDEGTRDAWVTETASQTQDRLDAFETGEALFGAEAREVYSKDVSGLEAAAATVSSENGI